jgi:hypothetical protein
MEEFVVFTVPNQTVIEKITLDSRQERELRIQVAAKCLLNVVSDLAGLLSLFDAEILPLHEKSTLTIKLFAAAFMKSSYVTDGKSKSSIRIHHGQIIFRNAWSQTRLETIEEETIDVST